MKIDIERLDPIPVFRLDYDMSEYGGLIGWLRRLPEGRVIIRCGLAGDRLIEFTTKKECEMFISGMQHVLLDVTTGWAKAPWRTSIQDDSDKNVDEFRSQNEQDTGKLSGVQDT
jgi:hypothetical protein